MVTLLGDDHRNTGNRFAIVPSVAHFCFGMTADFGGIRFGFVHFLAALLAVRAARFEKVCIHISHEPSGFWWDRTRRIVELTHMEPPTDVFGNPVLHPAHRADVVRLQVLQQQGGVYLDMDVWPLRPFDPLRECECVLGLQGRSYGLCNAVIVAAPRARFIEKWLDEYRDFDGARWDEHSVRRPLKIAWAYPHLVHILPESAFFWPSYDEPEEAFAETRWDGVRSRMCRALAEPGRLDRRIVRACSAIYGPRSTHSAVRRRGENLERLRDAYAVHLWESKWSGGNLERITPRWLARSSSVLASRAREVLGSETVAELEAIDDARE